MREGHVFVVNGDLTLLACDSVIVPTDYKRSVRKYWGRWHGVSVPEWQSSTKRVSRSVKVGDQLVRYLNVGATQAPADLEWLRAGLAEGLAAAGAELMGAPHAPLQTRERPLLGMPVIGVGGGGFDAMRGRALRVLLDEAAIAANTGFDVAIMCKWRSDYAALQSQRGQGDWEGALATVFMEADNLGDSARQGSLAMFLGAGVSKAAGLPD